MIKTIFIFIYGYLPGIKYGGPVTSIFNFTEHFGEEYDIRIICSNHDHGERKKYDSISKGWNKVGKAHVLYLSEMAYSSKKFYEIMNKYNVTLTYLTGVFSYKLNHAAIIAAKKIGCPIVIATRGEICVNILAMKKAKKILYLDIMRLIGEFRNVYFQVTSKEESVQLKKYLSIKDEKILELSNIHGKPTEYSMRNKEIGKADFVFVSRIHPKKNLLDVIKAFSLVDGEVKFDIYGPIEDNKYWERCRAEIQQVPQNVHIRYCGNLSTNKSRVIYENYHAFIFPTLSENYGHVIVESLISNCPVILSRNTTPWDDLDNNAGYVVDLHDINMLKDAIDRILEMDQTQYNSLIDKLEVYRNKKLKIKELIVKYQKIINLSSPSI